MDEDSDSSVVSDDSLLNFAPRTTPKDITNVTQTSQLVEIPAIFTVEGEKNRKLLQQNEEIQNSIVEDQRRARERSNATKELQLRVLDEINDNGSDFLFSMKNDAKIIEDYMERIHGQDTNILFERHYYFLLNCPIVKLDLPLNPVLQLVIEDLPAMMQDQLIFDRIMQTNNLNDFDLLVSALRYGKDPATLQLARQAISRRPQQEKWDENPLANDQKDLFGKIIAAIGGLETEYMTLKLVHYNNNPEILVHRLSIIFKFHLKYLKDTSIADRLFRTFVHASSDFLLNKTCNHALVRELMIPTFCEFVSWHTHQFDKKIEDSVVQASTAEKLHKILALLKVQIFKKNQTHKAWEQHYTFLENLSSHESVMDEHSRNVLNRLIHLFLDTEPAPNLLRPMNSVLRKLATQLAAQSNETESCGMFAVKLVISLLSKDLNRWLAFPRQEFHDLNEQLRATKSEYQRAIGSPHLARMEPMKRHKISMALGEAYHDLDYMSTVLDKNLILIRNNEFYEST